MLNDINEILFPHKSNKFLQEQSLNIDSLFNTNMNLDETETVTISYFYLNKDIVLDEENTIYQNTRLIGVDFCEQTKKINVCYNDSNSKKYFWINIDDIENSEHTQEIWNLNEIQLHNKAINEKWTAQKDKKHSLTKR